jgi:hypothetical protein
VWETVYKFVECVAKDEMGDTWGESRDRLIESITDVKVSEIWWKVIINGQIELITKTEVSEGFRKIGDALVESTAVESEMGERGREIVDGLVKQMLLVVIHKVEIVPPRFGTKSQVGQTSGEFVDGIVEMCAKNKMSERGRQTINWEIKLVAKSKVGEFGR